jgi:2,3-bisphosphoglycerate-dependent phosphoglycerate mutase
MTDADFKKQADQEIFRDVPRDKLPRTESMSDAYVRVVDCLRADIVPAIMGGKKILISAHGTSLRSIVKYLDGISDDEIMNLNIPTGMPLVYELGDNLKPIRHYYLGDEKELTEKIKKVENQGKAK